MSNARDKANIPALNFSSTGIDDNATATAITIDSSQRVGVGTTSPGFEFEVKDASGASVIRVNNGSANHIVDLIADGTGGLLRTVGSYPLVFNTNQTERARIDTSGRLLVGKTSTTRTVVGAELRPDGFIRGTKDASHSLDVVRTTDDGDAIRIYKDNTNVGVLGTQKWGIGNSNPQNKLDITALTWDDGLTIKNTGNFNVGIIGDANRSGAGGGLLNLQARWNGTEVAGILFQAGSDTTNKDDGEILFRTASAGTPTERVRITNAGLVGIGTSSPSAEYGSDTVLEISGSTSPGLVINDTGQGSKYGIHADSNDLKIAYGSTALVSFQNDGNVGIGTSTPGRKLQVSNGFIGASESSSNISSDQYNEFADNSSNWYNTKFANWSSSPASQYMIEVGFRNSSPDSSGAKFFQMLDQTTARVNINSDGDIQNHDNSYGGISDERIKQDIVDASSQWEDIKNIRIRKYKKKHDVIQYGEENAPIELGVISQELETVSPGLVKEDKADESHAQLHEDFTGDNPQNVKYVKYSILYMKSVKALQEAMERIETLEAEVTALKNQP